MKIGIILHPYGEKNPAGLARSILDRTRALLEADKENEYVIFLKNSPESPLEFSGNNYRIETLGNSLFWLNRLRKKPKCDIYIFNTPVLPLFWKPSKTVVVAHDFAYLSLGWGGARDSIRSAITFLYHCYCLHRADVIIAISNATKQDIIKFFRVRKGKIKIIFSGFKKICHITEKKITLPPRFFFFVGSLKKRKNVLNIVKAFYEFQKKNIGYHLVIAGTPQGAYYELLSKYVSEVYIGDKVLFIGHISDDELSYVYKRAKALVFPTFIEGFGFPVLEAMDCGIPVITSNQSSLAEVGGNESAFLVDPYKISNIADAMKIVVTDENKRVQLVQNGYKRAKEFSWHKAARELLVIINKL